MTPPELIILVGLPGSGKSTYHREHFAATHVHVSKDLMPNVRDRETRQRRVVNDALAAGRSVVVDNTNPTVASRAPLIEIARQHGARVVAIYFEAKVKDCVVRNRQREGNARVPDVAIFATAKRLVPPVRAEGFDEVQVMTT
jgi:predicted kinase